VGGKEGGGGRWEKWPKPCIMHIWIIKEKEKEKKESHANWEKKKKEWLRVIRKDENCHPDIIKGF
jgi:hypothetical protein